MDFKQRIIDELQLTSLQADTMLKDYIEVCEKLAKEYHALQLLQTDVVGRSEQFYCYKSDKEEHRNCESQCKNCLKILLEKIF